MTALRIKTHYKQLCFRKLLKDLCMHMNNHQKWILLITLFM
ncbi:hypothetical protein MNB_SUP05-SYMBIONT-5-836 [hydrothermal vent metagenome]|uniref:Uncharacterized protein n=1 Tax=hydrothermal vent metagenome TaxID=652676 RepID=A0A1W1E1B3_9ZZZZ